MTSSFHIFSLKFCKLFSPCSILHQSHPSLFVHLFSGKTWADVGYISFRTVGKNTIHFTIRYLGNQSFTNAQRVRCIILLTENKHRFLWLCASVLQRQYTYSKKLCWVYWHWQCCVNDRIRNYSFSVSVRIVTG